MISVNAPYWKSGQPMLETIRKLYTVERKRMQGYFEIYIDIDIKFWVVLFDSKETIGILQGDNRKVRIFLKYLPTKS